MSLLTPFARPFYIMLKPVGSQCNMECDYCYYREKAKLYSDALKDAAHSPASDVALSPAEGCLSPAEGCLSPAAPSVAVKKEAHSRQMTMSDELLEKFVSEYIASQTTAEVLFTWHGGEPFLLPLAFYRRAVELQKKYAGGRTIDNCIQTNGTLITPEWCEFLRDNHWLVGVSIDGPREMHDRHRRDQRQRGTFDRVMEGIRLLNEYGVEWNAMAVVNATNVSRPLEFYRFFKQIGCRYIQFTPIVERICPHSDGRMLAAVDEGIAPDAAGDPPLLTNKPPLLTNESITPTEWGDFLCAIFDEWVENDVGEYFIQIFESTLANWVGAPSGVCMLAPTCGNAAVMEHNGDLYACDHFVFPQYLLGNIRSNTLVEMMYGERQERFGRSKRDGLPQQCLGCRFLFACNGECPKNRFARSRDGEQGLNYLCEGYFRFFSHAEPYMNRLAERFG